MRIGKSTPFWKWATGSGLALLVTAELFARFVLGLGTPPLSVTHPTIEYMYKPNQDVFRFGNRFIVNEFGMRTKPFSKNRESINQIRVMIFGDSVINGGNLTDHQSLATTILTAAWKEELNVDVIVGNISAGSWGPGNWLAYAKEYGFFDADLVVIVLSSHDFNDNPEFKPLNSQSYPQVSPKFAILEGIIRYLPRYLRKIVPSKPEPTTEIFQEITTKGIDDLASFIELARESTPYVFSFQYPTRNEATSGQKDIGYKQIHETCVNSKIPIYSLHDAFHMAIQNGMDPYRKNDAIHPNDIGQKLIAAEIRRNIPKKALQRTH